MTTLSNKTIVLTGATDGIGLALAKKLSVNNRLIIIARSKDKLKRHFEDVTNVQSYVADLSSMKQVSAVIEEVLARVEKLDLLIHNASCVSSDRIVTPEGNELQLAVNYLAPVLITEKAKQRLSLSKGEVLFVNSRAHKRVKYDLSDPQLEDDYDLSKAYNRSKLYLILYGQKLAEDLKDRKVRVNSIHPGLVNTTMGEKNCNRFHQIAWKIMKQLGRSPEVAAQNIFRLLNSAEYENSSGAFFGPTEKEVPASIVMEQNAQNDLWKLTSNLLKTYLP